MRSRLAILSLLFGTAALAALVSASKRSVVAQEAGPDEAAFRVAAPSEGGKVKWTGREMVRNGGFGFGSGFWLLHGGISTVSEEADRDGNEAGASMAVSNALGTTAVLMQEISGPEAYDKLTARFDYRLFGGPQGGMLDSFEVVLGSRDFETGEYAPLVSITKVTPDNYPGAEWQKTEIAFSKDQRSAVQKAAGEGKQLYLWARLYGDGVTAHLDGISLKADGAFDYPACQGVLAVALETANGPQILTLSPDGKNREVTWRSENQLSFIKGVCWRPDGEALAFSSDHEMAWSCFTADLYELSAGGLKRLTNAPGLSEIPLPRMKGGSVRVKVKNLTREAVALATVYVQGGRSFGSTSLAAADTQGDEAEVVVEDIADLGEGAGQTVCLRVGESTTIAANQVDVVPGETVDLEGILYVSAAMSNFQAVSPCYKHDGTEIALTLGGLKTLPAAGGVPGDGVFGNLSGLNPAWSPVDDRLIYLSPTFSILSVRPGENAEVLVESPNAGLIGDLAWLPQGEGFFFTQDVSNAEFGYSGRNLCIYSFEAGASARLTDVYNEWIQSVAVSPDGAQIAFLRVPAHAEGRKGAELWIAETGGRSRVWRVDVEGIPTDIAWGRTCE